MNMVSLLGFLKAHKRYPKFQSCDILDFKQLIKFLYSDGMRCSPTSEMANRFYIYNYCWENFVHYDIKKDNETNEFVQDGDPTSMMYHKVGSDHCVTV